MAARLQKLVISGKAWQGLRVLVVGLGRFGGGVGVTRWLASLDAHVTVTDQADAASLAASIEAVSGLGVSLLLGGHDDCDLMATDLAVINPAVVKHRSSIFNRICEAGVPWTTEMNLFCERCPAPVVGVTGSYGKSTTCAMLAGILGAACRDAAAPWSTVHLGGNIGRSLLGDLDAIRDDDIVVLEMSNAQLEDLPRIGWRPRWAAITNLHPHHLDRYAGAASYFEAKLNVLGGVDPLGLDTKAGVSDQTVIVGDLCAEADVLFRRRICDRTTDVRHLLSEASATMELSIPGAHNVDNARCALAVARAVGVFDDVSLGALRLFSGLPHRLQFVREMGGVRFFNDSKSTSPAATCVSVAAMAGPVVLIAGGQDKPYAELAAWACAVASGCRVVLCIGESARRFSEAIGLVDGGSAQVEICADLAEAVRRAFALVQSGEAVLFSPGAPSFDAFANFAERGDHFVALVRQLS